MGSDDETIFFRCKSPMLDLRRKLIAPAEAAGFTGAAGDSTADEGPVTRAVALDEVL